ncbi:hypothetical protein [Streptomyces griseus]|uniref:hypothetical protein n=1 Tax=Streptomyces griseus TaxID=1911 RepID=UPI0004CB6D40|nr:hypothetical protein [Streptomyces griseus]
MTGNEPLRPPAGPPADGAGDPLPGGRLDGFPGPPPPATAFRAPPAGPEPAYGALRTYAPGAVPPEGAPSLGRSLALDEGDLVLDERSRDLALVVGADALGQALELAVATQTGSDRLNTGFGFDRLAIATYAEDLPTRKQFLTMELVRCVSSDLRVTDVREVFFDDDPRSPEPPPGPDGGARGRQTAAAHAARLHTVWAIVDTVAGTTVTLRARGTP